MERGTVENRIKPSCSIPNVSSKVHTRATGGPFDRFKPIHRQCSFSNKFFYLFISFFFFFAVSAEIVNFHSDLPVILDREQAKHSFEICPFAIKLKQRWKDSIIASTRYSRRA